MKKIITLLLLAITLASCNTQKGLQRAINKHGQKESIAYVVKKYPEYFKSTVVRDTIHDTIEVVVPEYKYETVVEFDSASVIENEKLKIEITRLKNGKLSVKAKCKTDTIYYPHSQIVEIPCPPCPDAEKITISNEKKEAEVFFKWSGVISWILVLAFIVFKVVKIINQNEPNQT